MTGLPAEGIDLVKVSVSGEGDDLPAISFYFKRHAYTHFTQWYNFLSQIKITRHTIYVALERADYRRNKRGQA